MIGGDILKKHISVVLSLLFKVPKFFKPMDSPHSGYLGITGKSHKSINANVLFNVFKSHTLSSNASPYQRLKNLKTYKQQKLGFQKGQQPKPYFILKTPKRHLGKELPNITYGNEKDRDG